MKHNDNLDHHATADLSDFEQHLRSLVPRPPLYPLQLTAPVQPAHAIVTVEARRGIYGTVVVSATLGALMGAACTLFMLRWMSNAEPTPRDTTVASGVAAPSIPTPKPTATAHHDPAANTAPLVPQAFVAQNPATANKLSMNAPVNWLDEFRKLRPGTLSAGMRLVSTPPSGRVEPHDSVPRASDSASSYGANNLLDANQPLTQRQWMQQILSSPTEFF